MQGGGQVDVETRELQLLHITVHAALDGQWMVGVALNELLGHVTHEAHQVLFAKLGVQAQFHPTWVQVVGDIEIHVCLGHDVRVGRAQLEGRNLYVIKGRVEPHTTCQVCDFQSALLLQGCLAHEERGALWRITDGVDAQTDIPQCEVVIVESLHLRLHTVVVGQCTVVPVETLHLIYTRAEVDIRPTGHSMPHIGHHVERVAR